MNQATIDELEAQCEVAIADVLRRRHHPVTAPVCRLMAKAAVAVLEAASATSGRQDVTVRRESTASPSKNGMWEIDESVVARVKAFIEQHHDNAFVRLRIATNLNENKPPVTKEKFWEVMVGCLLTTQQKSGPKSSVARFIGMKPFPLEYSVCQQQADLASFVTSVLTDFGGLRRTKNIGREAEENMEFLKGGGWERVSTLLDGLRSQPSLEAEKEAARFINDHFRGFGPKQSRNLLQGLGLSRFEIPIDSRIVKWLNEFGFPVKKANYLADRRYFERVSGEFQRLCKACDILPCVFDAVIFSSFDDGGWTEENVVW